MGRDPYCLRCSMYIMALHDSGSPSSMAGLSRARTMR